MVGFVMSVIGKWSKVVVFALEPAFYYLFIKYFLLLKFNFYTSMESYSQKLWKRSYEEIQVRIKIA